VTQALFLVPAAALGVRLRANDERRSHAQQAADERDNRDHHTIGSFGSWTLARDSGSAEIALRHLSLVRRKRSKDLVPLPLGHLDEVERSPQFGRDFIELLG
jgi:hypothetical protein